MATVTETQRPPLVGARARTADPDRVVRGALGVTTGPVARTIYALPFVVFGLSHFMSARQMAQLVPEWYGAPQFWVYVAGTVMIAAALAIVSGRLVVPAALALASMLGVFVLTVHIPGLMYADTMQMSLVNGLKDLALAGGALMAMRAIGHLPKAEPVPPTTVRAGA